MLRALMYFNAVCITVAFVVGALLRIGEIFRKDDESQEKNDDKNLSKMVKK